MHNALGRSTLSHVFRPAGLPSSTFPQLRSIDSPTLVFLNGLSYNQDNWQPLINELKRRFSSTPHENVDTALPFSVLTIDLLGQSDRGETPRQPIAVAEQAEEILNLLILLRENITGPIHLVGLSYGGGVALQVLHMLKNRELNSPHRESQKALPLISSTLLMAPYIGPLPDQVAYIWDQVKSIETKFPATSVEEARSQAQTLRRQELYDYCLRQMVYKIYAQKDPSLLTPPSRLERIFRLTQGAGTFSAAPLIQELRNVPIHLLLAECDEVVANHIHEKFWQQVHPTCRASHFVLHGVSHRMPEVAPIDVASWILEKVGIANQTALHGQRDKNVKH